MNLNLLLIYFMVHYHLLAKNNELKNYQGICDWCYFINSPLQSLHFLYKPFYHIVTINFTVHAQVSFDCITSGTGLNVELMGALTIFF